MTIYRCEGCWRLYGVSAVGEEAPAAWLCECRAKIVPFYGIDFATWAKYEGTPPGERP